MKASATDYVYTQAGGTPYLRVCRTADEKFRQQSWNGNKWVNGASKGPKIPYRLSELSMPNTDAALTVEGEKGADCLAALRRLSDFCPATAAVIATLADGVARCPP